ncbi:MAG: alpha/beta hydrolase [Rikenellaceae bacterium]
MRYLIPLLMLTLLGSVASAQTQFTPDVLGSNYEKFTIELPDTYDGEVVATLVRHKPLADVKRAVLYVHGYNDYFFQTEMAEKFIEQGWQFYAVDLRRYGRSMREWHSPFYVLDIAEYFEEIDASLDIMKEEGMEQIVLMGHSTGGLTTSLYCHHNRKNLKVDALILNSPFFDMNLGGGLVEGIGVPFVSTMGSLFKDWRIQKGNDEPGGYGKSISNKYDGEWEFDTQFKRIESLPINAGWIRAIHRAQRQLQKGLEVPCPVLVLYSDKSIEGEYDAEKYKSGDSVLDVEDIAEFAPLIGKKVTAEEVAGGMHDIVLSPEQVRYPLYNYIFEWINSNVE